MAFRPRRRRGVAACRAVHKPPEKAERASQRLSLQLETVASVLVRSEEAVQWGIARNIRAGGLLVEVRDLLPVGTPVEIRFTYIGETPYNTSVTFAGTVGYQIHWQTSDKPEFRALGIRFVRDVDGLDRPHKALIH